MNMCYAYGNLPDEIKLSLSNANVFFSEEYYLNVLNRGQKQLFLWSDRFILVARIKSKFFLKCALLESEPFRYDGINDEDDNIVLKDFLNQVMVELKKEKITWTITTNTSRFQAYPDNSKCILSGNYIIDLTLSEEELWQKVHSKHRNSIRRGEKSNLTFKVGDIDLVEEYTGMANETYKRSGGNETDSKYYFSLIEKLDKKSRIVIAYKNSVPQAAGMFIFNKKIAYYLHGASVARPEPGSTNYLLWKTIIDMKNCGIEKFSFVGYHFNPEAGSKLEGIQNFKSRFGGYLEQCYSFKFIHKPFCYKMYCFAMRLRSGKITKKYQDAIDTQINNFKEVDGILVLK